MKSYYNKLAGFLSLSLLVLGGITPLLFQNCGGFQAGEASTFSSLESAFGSSENYDNNHKLSLSVRKKEANHLGELDLIRYIAYCAKNLPLSYIVENGRAQRIMSKTTFNDNRPENINKLINEHVSVNFEDIYIEGDANFFLCFDHNNNDSCKDEKLVDLNDLVNRAELGEFAILFAREANGISLHPHFSNYFKESCERDRAFFDKIRSEGLIIFHSQLADIKNRNRMLNGQVARNLQSDVVDTAPDDFGVDPNSNDRDGGVAGNNQGDNGMGGNGQGDGGNAGGQNGEGGNGDGDGRIVVDNGGNDPEDEVTELYRVNDPYGRLNLGGITTDNPNGNNGEGRPLISRGLRFNLIGLTDNDMSFDENMPPPRVTVTQEDANRGVNIVTCQVTVDGGEKCTKAYRRTAGCFVSGTKIKVSEEKSLPIEMLKKGDELVLLDGRKKSIKKVITGPEKDKVVSLRTKSGEKLRITQKHPMWTTKGYKLARELTLKDQLILEGGKAVAIESIEMVEYKYNVFNIELEGDLAEDHIVIANGIASGDLFIQQKMEKEVPSTLAQRLLKTVKKWAPKALQAFNLQ